MSSLRTSLRRRSPAAALGVRPRGQRPSAPPLLLIAATLLVPQIGRAVEPIRLPIPDDVRYGDNPYKQRYEFDFFPVLIAPDASCVVLRSERTHFVWETSPPRYVQGMDADRVLFSADSRNILAYDSAFEKTERERVPMTHVLRTPLLAIDREIEGFNPAAYSPDGRFVVESLSGFQFAMRDAQTFIPLQSPQLVGGPAYEANNYDALA